MSSQDTEGRREIEAARKRLLAARAHESSAREMARSAGAAWVAARKNLEAAQAAAGLARSQLERSRKEVREAEDRLKDAEARWEVVDVDDDSRGGGNELDGIGEEFSGGDGDGSTEEGEHFEEDAIKDEDTDTGDSFDSGNESIGNGGLSVPINGHEDFDYNDESDVHEGQLRHNATSNVDEITVEGSGISGANGIYKIGGERNGSPEYFKQGHWEGKGVCFRLYRLRHVECWCIKIAGQSRLYKSPQGSASLPPKIGWLVEHFGIMPAPQLNWQ